MDELRDVVRRALEEDAAWDDVTTKALVENDQKARGALIAKQECIIAGMDAFSTAFFVYAEREPGGVLEISITKPDGAVSSPVDVVATVEGPFHVLLGAERTALNFVQRLSGIATLTRAFVDRAGGVAIRDTRKTTPGLRALEKAAVRAGGGTSHRPDLASAILIKDNHIAALGGDIAEAITRAKATGKHVEVECETLDQVAAAIAAGADELLLDNMDLDTMRAAVALAEGKVKTEASGGVTIDTVADVAATGVDSISVGALTHSAPAIDLSLEIEAI